MPASQNFRGLVAWVLTCALFVTGLIIITTEAGRAARRPLPPSPAPTANASAEKPTVPQAIAVDDEMRERVNEAYSKLPLSFEENRGQVDKEVRYFSRGRGYTLFLTPTEVVLSLSRADGGLRGKRKTGARAYHERQTAKHSRQSAVLRMKLKGATLAPAVTGESEMSGRANYFIGSDPKNWHTDVARYERVRYAGAYPGVDVIYYGEQQQLEYDFEVAPGADMRQIRLEFAGVRRMKVESATGELVLKTAGGEVRQHRPVAYQEVRGERREVASRYVMKGAREVGIEVGEYDRAERLVIDPVLTYSTYVGGNDDEFGRSIAVDSSGNAYVTGWVLSTDFPTLNAYEPYGGQGFVTKLDTNASGAASLRYSTYLGHGEGDVCFGIAVDSSGNAYVAGEAASEYFPTFNQFQNKQSSFADATVTKLNTNVSGDASLVFSTYLGGSLDEYAFDIAVDPAGNAYVTGATRSPDFPTLRKYQSHQAGYDLFVTKLTITNLIRGRVTSDGTTGLGGVTVTLSGSKSATVVTNSSGNFSFRNLPPGGNYKITPSKGDVTFVPSAQRFTDLQINPLDVNFRTRPAAISGRVTVDTADGAPLAGVTMTLTGGAGFAPRKVKTTSYGTYSFTNLPTPGNYKMTPSKAGYNFSPEQAALINLTAGRPGTDFVASLKTHAARGVRDDSPSAESGEPRRDTLRRERIVHGSRLLASFRGQ